MLTVPVIITPVKRAAETDRRQHPRFPQLLEMLAHELPTATSPPATPAGDPISGRVQNVSQGGLCVLSPRPLAKAALLRCEILGTDMPVPIPTLMQVRWTRKQRVSPESYLCGLKFLL